MTNSPIVQSERALGVPTAAAAKHEHHAALLIRQPFFYQLQSRPEKDKNINSNCYINKIQ